MRTALAALLCTLTVLSWGCSGPASDRAAGESCFRTSECADGLACVSGQCTTDLGLLLEAGMPALLPDSAMPDAGPVVVRDAGGMDAGPPRDSGPPPPRDSGPPPPRDSGPPPPMDSGPPPPADSGPPPMDSGAPG